MANKISLSRKIRTERLKLRFTTAQVASLLNIAEKELLDIEEGKRNPPKVLVEDMATLFGVEFQIFLKDVDYRFLRPVDGGKEEE